ncbi:MFS transporter [Rhodococcus sp. 06-621-2]|nr:MFS transporter [Rhodococcus sp. 06-621-2]OZC55529.1 MFS transporter [Rhodococcus sp. 06-621-2]
MSSNLDKPKSGLSDTVGDQLDNLPVSKIHRKVVLAVGLGLFFEMYEIFLSSTISVALKSEWGLEGNHLKLLLASSFLGMFFGAAFLGRLADIFGRKRAFMINLIWFSAWSLIAAFSMDPWMLVVARFFAGVGLGAEYPVADAYLSDVLPKDKRGKLASLAYTCSYVAVPFLGFLSIWLADEAIFDIAGWRWLLALGGIGALIVLFLRRGIPESPRWLVQQGRIDEAQVALDQFAAGTGTTTRPIVAKSIEDSADGESTDNNPLTSSTSSSKPSLRIAFERPYSIRLLMMTLFHLFQTFGYYGFGTLAALVLVSRGYDITSSLLFTAVSFLGYPLGSLLSIPLLARYERKYLLIFSIAAMAGFGLGFAMSSSTAVIIVCGFMTTVMGNVYSNAYHIYQAEIFPTSIRVTAVGWTYSLSRLSSAAMPFILIPVLESYGAGPMFAVITVALTIVVLSVWILGPRTNGRSLEEINPTVESDFRPTQR